MAHDALDMIEYSSEPAVLLVADCEPALERAARTLGLAGCRLAAAAWLEEAEGRMDERGRFDAVLVELEGPADAAVIPVLDRLQAAAVSGRYRSVVSAPEPLIDLIAARAPHAGVAHLCGAREAERIAQIAFAAAPTQPVLRDIRGQEGSPVLLQLSEEVARVAAILAALAGDDSPAGLAAPLRGLPEPGKKEPAVDADFVRSIIRTRRLRDQWFQSGLFADPAWDMMLDLMAARLDGERVAVSSLCIAAAVPPTTALRWIKTMCDHGLFVRIADPEDGRRVFIELSDQAARRLSAYLGAARRTAEIVL